MSTGQAPLPTPGVAPQIVFVHVPWVNHRYDVYDKFAGHNARLFGCIILTVAIGNICFGIAGLVINDDRSWQYENNFFSIGSAIWCPCFSVIAGGLSVGAGRRKTRCMIRAMMSLCIMSMFLELANVVMCFVGISNESGLDMKGSFLSLICLSLLCSTTAIILCGLCSALGGKSMCCQPSANGSDGTRVQYVAGAPDPTGNQPTTVQWQGRL